jgi:hypothetical protein
VGPIVPNFSPSTLPRPHSHLISPVFEAEPEPCTRRWVSCLRPSTMAVRNLLFCLVRHRVFSDRASRALFAAAVSFTGRLATVLSIYFQDTDRFYQTQSSQFRCGTPTHPPKKCLIRRARRSRLSRSGLLTVLSWIRCHRPGSCLAGCTRRT